VGSDARNSTYQHHGTTVINGNTYDIISAWRIDQPWIGPGNNGTFLQLFNIRRDSQIIGNTNRTQGTIDVKAHFDSWVALGNITNPQGGQVSSFNNSSELYEISFTLEGYGGLPNGSSGRGTVDYLCMTYSGQTTFLCTGNGCIHCGRSSVVTTPAVTTAAPPATTIAPPVTTPLPPGTTPAPVTTPIPPATSTAGLIPVWFNCHRGDTGCLGGAFIDVQPGTTVHYICASCMNPVTTPPTLPVTTTPPGFSTLPPVLTTTPPINETTPPDVTTQPPLKPGDVDGNGYLTIIDALEILMFLAGLDSVLDQPAGYNAARAVTGGVTPSISDALEILMWLAGMNSALDAHWNRS
jgi:hypothetical protein